MGRPLRPLIIRLEGLVTKHQAVVATLSAEQSRLSRTAAAADAAAAHSEAIHRLSRLIAGVADADEDVDVDVDLGGTPEVSQAELNGAASASAPGGRPDAAARPLARVGSSSTTATAGSVSASGGGRLELHWSVERAARLCAASDPAVDFTTAAFQKKVKDFVQKSAHLLM
jgi:hypothetical protein